MKGIKSKDYSEISITGLEFLNECYFILQTEPVSILPLPGQFYLLKPLKNFPSLLHIPVSIYNIEDNKLQFLIKKIGSGTESLAALSPGQKIRLLGPLGNQFQLVENKKVLLVSGGIGYAPLYLLKQHLLLHNNTVTWLHGGKSAQDILPTHLICTEDGSLGDKGLVTEKLIKILAQQGTLINENSDYPLQKGLNSYDLIYCCGPKAMMIEIWKITSPLNIALQVSLEEYMACGLGSCYGCAVKIRNEQGIEEYKRVCYDGPVFNANEVIWDE